MKLIKFVLFIILCIGLGLSFSCKKEHEKLEFEVELSNSFSHYENMYYADVYNEFKRMGFKYVEYSIVYDLEEGSNDFGVTSSVTIEGESNFSKGDIYSKYQKVVITYHSFISKDPSNSPIKDTYDKDYTGETYRVNFIVNYDSVLSTASYNVYFRIDGYYFQEVYNGASVELEVDLKPGVHTISFTKGEDIGTYDLITLDVDSDMMVTYLVSTKTFDIKVSQSNIDKDAYCIIKFDSNGGNKVEDYKIKKGHKLYDLEEPTGMDDYRFKGWYIEENTKITYPFIVDSDLNVFAVWKPKSDYIFELCFELLNERGMHYILIDLDRNYVVFVTTASEYVQEGTLKEDNGNGYLTIKRKDQFDLYIKYLNEKEVSVFYFENQQGDDSIYKVVDSEDAEKYLDSIGFDYK